MAAVLLLPMVGILGLPPSGVAQPPRSPAEVFSPLGAGAAHIPESSLPVGSEPIGAVLDPATGYLYTANFGSGNLSVIDVRNASQIATIPVGLVLPYGLAIDPAAHLLYASDAYGSSSHVARIDLTNDSVVGYASVGTNPHGTAFDPANGRIYVANMYSNTVSVLTGATGAPIASVPVGSLPDAVAYDPVNGYVYVANDGSSTVSVLNPTTDATVATVPVGAMFTNTYYGTGIAVDASDGVVYVTDDGASAVSVLSNLTVVATIPVGSDPFGVAWDPATDRLFVANVNSNNVSVIATPANTVLAPWQNLQGPSQVVIDPVSGGAYVTNLLSDRVSGLPDRFPVAFHEAGLPTGASWSIDFGGQSYATQTGFAAAGTIVNGTYAYSIGGPRGFHAQPSTGSLVVQGAPVNQTVAFVANATNGAGPGLLGLPGADGYILVGGVVAAAVIVGLLVATHSYAAAGGGAVVGGVAGRRAIRRRLRGRPAGPAPPTAAGVTPARFCRRCGVGYRGTERFCTKCGTPR